MSPIHQFSVDDMPMYSPQFPECMPTVLEDSVVEEVSTTKKKPSERRQKKTMTIRNDEELRSTPWTTEDKIALCKPWVRIYEDSACHTPKNS
ncbi:hypothetical protein Tco_0870391, partial [Tanacetum coccineum]